MGELYARFSRSSQHHRLVRHRRLSSKRGGEAVIAFTILALVLGIAGLVYLVVALLKPERF